MTAAGGAAPTITSEWIDCSGWVDKRVSWEQDNAGTSDLDISMQISPEGYYELNNKTASTQDYEQSPLPLLIAVRLLLLLMQRTLTNSSVRSGQHGLL